MNTVISLLLYYALPIGIAWLIGSVLFALFLRVVVPTNEVHIAQSSARTTTYGTGQPAGNTYYKWPSWMPRIGIRVTVLPVSVFKQPLSEYAAYDKGRLPFVLDVIAFFRITDPAMAAQRVVSFKDLQDQLENILKGVIRTILANSQLEEILEGRSQFSDMFTKEVDTQLKEWGLGSVKNIELIDIRDYQGSNVIAQIMMKQKSRIEMESRIQVASNLQSAETAEITARQAVQTRAQEARQMVEIRTAEADKASGVAKQLAQQEINTASATTMTTQMAVAQVEHVRSAEITKQVETVKAEQQKAVAVVTAEGNKAQAVLLAEGQQQSTIILAEGQKQSQVLNADGLLATGTAKAESERLLLTAPVRAQIDLAKEIGQNAGYQKYLVDVKGIEAAQAVGTKQAEALAKADVKVISTVGTPQQGLGSVMDLFSAAGGTQLGGMLEAIRNTPTGQAIEKKLANGHTAT